jgi:hypothetical protein
MRTIEFNGVSVEYDERLVHSWKWQKRLAKSDGMAGLLAVEELLLGKDEEVAEAIGDDVETMGKLVASIIDENNKAKN